ncbi:MAG: hypothetical protein P1S46_03850 [bacterium]|nr:hypothetical protein [bacterium]MDT8396713.1 hypothetical protein [bacterium]
MSLLPMTSGLPRLFAVFTLLLLMVAPSSCVKVRGPGIMPPVDESGFGEWFVRSMGYRSITTMSGEPSRQWSIIARFSPDDGGEGITALDITAAVDGEPVPFTFEEDIQLLESEVSSTLNTGVHEFSLVPSENAVHSFPTLRVRFEAP